MLGLQPGPHGDVAKEQRCVEDGEVQGLLCEATGSSQQCSETHMEAKSLHMHRVQECTACIQVRHSKAKGMGGQFDAVLSAVWELRPGHEDQCATNDMQSVL